MADTDDNDGTTIPAPVLVLVRGLPGSGKSHISHLLQAKLGTDACIVLDPDTIDYASTAYADHVARQIEEGVDAKLHPYRFLRAQAYAAIENRQIILWNQPFSNLEILQKVTDRLSEHAAAHNTSLSIVVVELNVPKETAWQRIQDRKRGGGHGPSRDRFDQFVREYAPAAHKSYHIITVDSQGDVATAVADIVDTIRQLHTARL